VTVGKVRTITRRAQVEAPGTLALDETRTARIGAMVEGKIVALGTEVGARVTVGAVLAEIRSQGIHLAWADYRKAIAERRRRTAELQYAVQAEARTHRLYAAKVISRQEVERARVERVAAEEALNVAQTEVRRTEEVLEHLGITPGEDPGGESGKQIPVKSPLTGAVLEKHATIGTAVTPGTPLFVVSDLSTLWALAEVDETKLPLLQVGRTVEVRVTAYPGDAFPGTIVFVGDTLDPKTRRITVRCRIPNPHERLKPNMYATLGLGEGEARSVVAVPTQALQELNGKRVVFTTDDARTFSVREVTVGNDVEGWAEITAGLQAGEQVAVTGSFLLKSELLQATVPDEE
jgi:cobalt-zinc-cadmium efflux system membrane fusion protein